MIAFSLGPITVYRYGIMYLLSFLIGYAILSYGATHGRYRQYPQIEDMMKHRLDDLMIAILLGVMIGGRMGHVLIYDLSYFITHPLKVFAVSDGGMSFIGGIIGTILSVGVYSYQLRVKNGEKKILNSTFNIENVLSLLDAFIPLVPVGIFFGRFGNFLNQELYGIIVPYHNRGMPAWLFDLFVQTNIFYVYDQIGPALRINTNFLSMVFEGLVLAIVLWLLFFRYWINKKWNPGNLSAVFLGGYSAIRFVLEYLRQDSQAEFVGYFTKSQWFFILFMIIAFRLFVWSERAKIEK